MSGRFRPPTAYLRNAPYYKQSPRKVFQRGPTTQVLVERNNHRTIYSREYTQPCPTQVRIVEKEKQQEWTLNDPIAEAFLEKNVDVRNANKIGGGRYSKVYLVTEYTREGISQQIAMKIINETKHSQEYLTKFLPREIECWKQLEHPYLVRLHGHYSGAGYTFLTMEYGTGGDLLSYVMKFGAVGEDRGRIWASQIIRGLGYIHSLGIAHRDLKLENIVLFSGTVAKIADFGFAKSVGTRYSETHCGSKSYTAPEILQGKPYNPYKSDSWAIGIIIYIMMTNQMPFNEQKPNHQIIEIQRNGINEYPVANDSQEAVSEECREVIRKLLAFDPHDRPKKVTACLNCQWFKNTVHLSNTQ